MTPYLSRRTRLIDWDRTACWNKKHLCWWMQCMTMITKGFCFSDNQAAFLFSVNPFVLGPFHIVNSPESITESYSRTLMPSNAHYVHGAATHLLLLGLCLTGQRGGGGLPGDGGCGSLWHWTPWGQGIGGLGRCRPSNIVGCIKLRKTMVKEWMTGLAGITNKQHM